jgi:hypothetical protein
MIFLISLFSVIMSPFLISDFLNLDTVSVPSS